MLEGGYSVSGIKEAGRRVLRRLAGLDEVPAAELARLRHEGAESVPGLKQVLRIQREFWDLD